MLAFAAEFDPQPMHLDEEAAKRSMLKGLSGSGWHLCSIMMRMMFDGYIGRTASLGSPGVNELRWLAPLRPGDDLTLDVDVAEARVSRSRPETGIVTFKGSVRNAAGQALCEMVSPIIVGRRTVGSRAGRLMRFFEDIEIGQRREVGSFTFTAELIKKFAAQFDPQRFHLDEEEGRKSLFGGLAASGWHVGSVCMKLLVADGQRQAREAAGARREGRGLGTVAGLSRSALDQAGAGRRHHQLRQRGRIAAHRRRSVPNGASCRPATPAPTSAANWCSRCWRRRSCRGGTPNYAEATRARNNFPLTHCEPVPVIVTRRGPQRGRR